MKNGKIPQNALNAIIPKVLHDSLLIFCTKLQSVYFVTCLLEFLLNDFQVASSIIHYIKHLIYRKDLEKQKQDEERRIEEARSVAIALLPSLVV